VSPAVASGVPSRVWLAEGDGNVRSQLRELIASSGVEVMEAGSTKTGTTMAEMGMHPEEQAAVVVLGFPLLKPISLEWVCGLYHRVPRSKLIVVARGPGEVQVETLLRSWALEWLRYPLKHGQLELALRRVLSEGKTAPSVLPDREGPGKGTLHFVSESMRELSMLATRVAVHDVTVLITGESGTGKERIADLIVRASRRADKPYLRFNCASLSPELVEAELFGHSRGAFTGAIRSRPGLFGEADGGTLLLDEIGELGLSAQSKLLRVLQEREIKPVGEERARKVDVRILAATHCDLPRLCQEGTFRRDLFYRLNVVPLKTVPLRERPEDIPVIADHVLERCRARFGVSLPALPREFYDRISAYHWPGNVRELENAIEHMVVLSAPGTLDLSLLPASEEVSEPGQLTLRERLDAYERVLITRALLKARNRRSVAAALLGISRVTLYEKLHKFGIAGERGRDDADMAI
jgi:two-component system response regulator HydG